MIKEWLAALLKLVRVQNLLIIAATQFFVRLFVINPVFFSYKIEHSLSSFEFILFVAATLCIAAAGYIINDYFDIDIDRINKPQKMVIGKYFSRREAFRLHIIFNIAGAALGIYCAWLAGNIRLGFIFIIAAGLLWFYAKTFKKVFLLGNIIVSIVTALTILVTAYFENWLFLNTDLLTLAANREVMQPVFAYALFAFMTTLIREIVKDAEDMEGDRQFGSKSLPIVLGMKWTKGAIAALCLVLIAMLFVAQSHFFKEEQFVKISYILIALQLPAVVMLFNLIPASSKEDFAKLSEWMKIIMLLGVASMAVFHYIN